MFNLDKFIADSVTFRRESMFRKDIESNAAILSREIEGKSVCVIGGAGSIGSSFIKAVLEFRPGKVVVIDLNENGLAELVRDIRSTEGLFALKVVGLSMKDAGILDGDIVVADKNAPCHNGDIIIGMDGDDATVKRLKIEKDGSVVYMPENPDFSPIYPESPSVLGKVIGCYRRY